MHPAGNRCRIRELAAAIRAEHVDDQQREPQRGEGGIYHPRIFPAACRAPHDLILPVFAVRAHFLHTLRVFLLLLDLVFRALCDSWIPLASPSMFLPAFRLVEAGRINRCPHLLMSQAFSGRVASCRFRSIRISSRPEGRFCARNLLVNNDLIVLLLFAARACILDDRTRPSSIQPWTARFNPGTLGASR